MDPVPSAYAGIPRHRPPRLDVPAAVALGVESVCRRDGTRLFSVSHMHTLNVSNSRIKQVKVNLKLYFIKSKVSERFVTWPRFMAQ